MQTRTTRLKTRRRMNSMISPRRVNQAERSHQRPPRYLTSIKPRTAHHVGIQGRGVAPLITDQIVGPRSSSRQKNRWRWFDRRVAPDRFWQTYEIVVGSSWSGQTHVSHKILRDSLDICFQNTNKYYQIYNIYEICPLLYRNRFSSFCFSSAKIWKTIFFHFLIYLCNLQIKIQLLKYNL